MGCGPVLESGGFDEMEGAALKGGDNLVDGIFFKVDGFISWACGLEA